MSKDPPTNPRLNQSEETPAPAGQLDAAEAPAAEQLNIPPITEGTLPANGQTLPADEATGEAAVTTEPLPINSEPVYRNTIPLEEEAGTVPLQPLDVKTVLDERYRVEELLGNTHGTNVYRATDLQGYRLCWACGSDASREGDTYCVDCGAQLTGRVYRLQEFAAPDGHAAAINDAGGEGMQYLPLPAAILENSISGIARVYDLFEDTTTRRIYVVWEEVYGRTLASWLPGASITSMLAAAAPAPAISGHLLELDEPEEEQALIWMSQSADLLAALHQNGITHCSISLDNLVVQPGDRIALLEPSGCVVVEPGDTTTNGNVSTPEHIADIRSLASELERWYIDVRGVQGAQPAQPQAQTAEQTPGLVSAVDEVTGPLGTPSEVNTVLRKAKEGMYETAAEFAHTLHDLYEASRPITNIYLWSGRASDVGRVRQINEDSLLTLEVTIMEHEGILPVSLYVIADGMGGHQSGEIASSIAVRTIGSVVNSSLVTPLSAGDPVATDQAACTQLLRHAVLEANRRITDLAKERHSDLGTTVTVALIVGNSLHVANVGDSRTYLWADDQLNPITRDHSLVAQLVASGQLAPDDIYTHPRRNEIYRALGDPRLTPDDVDTFHMRLQPGSGVLLCSDGLWDFVRDPNINKIIMSPDTRDPQSICQALIDRANAAGGEDNITTIFVRVLSTTETG